MLRKKLTAIVMASIQTAVMAFGLVAVSAPAYAVDCNSSLTLQCGVDSAGTTDTQGKTLFGPKGIFQNIASILIFIVGAVAVIMLIVGGLRYVLSAGDSKNVTAAKDTILYAIVGIVVALLSLALVNFVVSSVNKSTTGSATTTTN
ncbi:MAG: pilin [Candidatus Saccharibacteria bacterium]